MTRLPVARDPVPTPPLKRVNRHTDIPLYPLMLLRLLLLCASSMAANLLEHRAWRLEGWSVSSLNPHDFLITFNVADGRVSGKSAVNSYSGPVTVSASSSSVDGTIAVGPLMSTRMAGPPDAMRAENLFHTLLSSVTNWHVSDKKLTLKDGSGNEALLFREG